MRSTDSNPTPTGSDRVGCRLTLTPTDPYRGVGVGVMSRRGTSRWSDRGARSVPLFPQPSPSRLFVGIAVLRTGGSRVYRSTFSARRPFESELTP
jgi:hypothetical protein